MVLVCGSLFISNNYKPHFLDKMKKWRQLTTISEELLTDDQILEALQDSDFDGASDDNTDIDKLAVAAGWDGIDVSSISADVSSIIYY